MRQLTIFQFLLVCGLSVANLACSNQNDTQISAEASYDRLCKVYEEVKNHKPRSDARGDMLVERLHQEVPELFGTIGHIFNAARKDIYGLYKQSAEYAMGKSWECPAIMAYYQES